MNIVKQWYLRLFFGYILVNDNVKGKIEHALSNCINKPEFTAIGANQWLLAPPKKP